MAGTDEWVDRLKALKEAEVLYLATDEDRQESLQASSTSTCWMSSATGMSRMSATILDLPVSNKTDTMETMNPKRISVGLGRRSWEDLKSLL